LSIGITVLNKLVVVLILHPFRDRPNGIYECYFLKEVRLFVTIWVFLSYQPDLHQNGQKPFWNPFFGGITHKLMWLDIDHSMISSAEGITKQMTPKTRRPVLFIYVDTEPLDVKLGARQRFITMRSAYAVLSQCIRCAFAMLSLWCRSAFVVQSLYVCKHFSTENTFAVLMQCLRSTYARQHSEATAKPQRSHCDNTA